jgi:hypothetical protein
MLDRDLTKRKLDAVVDNFYFSFVDSSKEELEFVLETARNWSATNCWFVKFYLRDAIIKHCEGRLQDLELEAKNKSEVK